MHAIRFRTIRSAVAAYNSVVTEQGNTELAYARLDQARLEAERAAEELADPSKIHDTDRMRRDINRLRAEQELRQLQHEARLADMERKSEMQHARVASKPEEKRPDLSQDEQELAEALLAKLKPDRYRALLEKTIKEQNLSTADEERAYQVMEELIRQSL